MMKMLLFIALIAFAAADTCGDCYLAYAGIDYDITNSNLKDSICPAGAALTTCLSAANCDTFYEQAWSLTCNALQCGGCPAQNSCGLCQSVLDIAVSAAATASNLLTSIGGNFDLSALDAAMCTAIDAMGTCADSAASLDGKPCNIKAKNCAVLKSVCASTSCTPAGLNLADLAIAVQNYKDLFQVRVQGVVAEIKTALQQSQQQVNGKLHVKWEIVLEAAADRAQAIAKFTAEIAKNLGVAEADITVNTGVAPRKRQTTETWTVEIGVTAASPASTIVVSAAALFLVALLF